MALTKIKCRLGYIWAIVAHSGDITAHDQSMVESDVTEGGKNTASFQWTQQHKHEASS